MHSLVILGRQPALGLAELESLFGADSIRPIAPQVALIDKDAACIPFKRLGGSVKLAHILAEIPSQSWRDIEKHLHTLVAEHVEFMPAGKIRFGISAFDIKVNTRELGAAGLRLKKTIKAAGRSVRIIPNKTLALNSAQVLHNQLTGPTGWELVLVRNGNKTIAAQTIAEQDIEAYAARDQGRPLRDARVGMLPPKLAQIITNLALGDVSQTDFVDERLLDPFCGTGVVLQEALLMGYNTYGTDLEPRMIDYSRKNLEWLYEQGLPLPASQFLLEVGDATSHSWDPTPYAVACETYLGTPFTSLPPAHILKKAQQECDEIHKKFLQNLGKQIRSGKRLCLAVPAWKTKNGFLHLETLDLLEELGYTRQKFVHARDADLIYHRPDQVVARELVVLEKK